MAVKTITIDMEAYELLARHKRPKQSFSQVIKEHFGKQRTGRDLLAAIQRLGLRDDTLDAVEVQVGSRRRDRARAARL